MKAQTPISDVARIHEINWRLAALEERAARRCAALWRRERRYQARTAPQEESHEKDLRTMVPR
jgi:hypothetical protein